MTVSHDDNHFANLKAVLMCQLHHALHIYHVCIHSLDTLYRKKISFSAQLPQCRVFGVSLFSHARIMFEVLLLPGDADENPDPPRTHIESRQTDHRVYAPSIKLNVGQVKTLSKLKTINTQL